MVDHSGQNSEFQKAFIWVIFWVLLNNNRSVKKKKKEKEKAPPSCTAAEAAASFVAEPCPTGGLPGITRAQAVPSQVCA